MLQVAGVGERKYENYGETFLAEIRKFTRGRKEKTYFGEMGAAEAVMGLAGNGSYGKPATRKVQKQPFMITSIRAAEFRPTDVCLATELAVELNQLADLQTVQKLSGAEILRYAIAQGWVQEVYQEGQWRKLVTEAGDNTGFFLGKRVSQHGTEYEVVFLSAMAQQVVLEHYTDLISLTDEPQD